jgi:hypothetical protein
VIEAAERAGVCTAPHAGLLLARLERQHHRAVRAEEEDEETGSEEDDEEETDEEEALKNARFVSARKKTHKKLPVVGAHFHMSAWHSSNSTT